MKTLKTVVALLVLMPAAVGIAWADHGHFDHGGHGNFHSRVYLGIGFGPYWGPTWYYPPPAYYYPPPIVYSSPPVYVEQAPSTPPAANYWYYCANAKRYYPYVKDCPGGWQQVSPAPPDSR